MPRTLTPNFGWELPEITGDSTVWGNVLNIVHNTVDGQIAQKLEFKSTGTPRTRWRLYRDSDAESTGDAGSTLRLDAYHDDGTLSSTVLTVNRATRRVQVLQAPVDPNDVVRKSDLIGGVMIGGVIAWGGSLPTGTTIPPTGYLLCNGATYHQADYPALFAVISTRFGTAPAGDFKVPNIDLLKVVGTTPIPDLWYIIKAS